MPAWRRLTFSIPEPFQEDLIVSLHEQGSLGIEVRDDYLCAYLVDPVDETALLASLGRALGWGVESLVLEASEPVADGFWHESWMKSLSPIEVGDRFLVLPGPVAPSGLRGRLPIRLTPERAFGTGEHATTRMCLRLLESRVRAGASFLDVGTGSGILAIAAHLLGAGLVLGIDIDEPSLAVAARNAVLNEAEGVLFAAASPESLTARPFDLVVANISGTALQRLMGSLVILAEREAILSGILQDEQASVRKAASRSGLRVADVVSEDGWMTMLLEKTWRG